MTTNLPLPNGIKIVSVLERLHGEIRRTISDVQKRDRQTNKQTGKLETGSNTEALQTGSMRKTPNALNTREQGKEGRRVR